MLYKGKDDPQETNNHSGIALMETSAKVLSIILAEHLLKRLKQINPTSQFWHIGCQESQHTIKGALILHRQHGESYAVFVDLVKAFDTVHHILLYRILAKCRLPPSIIQNIEILYKHSKYKIKIGRFFTEVGYTTGVQQGDNMSLVLLLFVMQMFLDILSLDAQPIQYSYFPENKNGNMSTCNGRLLGQNSTVKGTPFDFHSSFCVDNSFFMFNNRHQLYNALILLNKHCACFGLSMHIGSSTTKSKTECMFFPATLNLAIFQLESNLLPDNFIPPNDGQIHFVTKFKYVGSLITPLLNKDTNWS
jgi:hypothetical protein